MPLALRSSRAARHARATPTGGRARSGRPAPRGGGVGAAALAVVAVLGLASGAGAGALVSTGSPLAVPMAAAPGTALPSPAALDGGAEAEGGDAPGVRVAEPLASFPRPVIPELGPVEMPEAPEPVAEPVVVDPDAVDAQGLTVADRDAGLLSTAVPTAAKGTLLVAAGEVPAPAPDREVVRVRVEVEAGLPVDVDRFAAQVMATLNDPRGWGADGSVSFARTAGEAEIRVVLASPDVTDAMCAPLSTAGRYSCGRNGHAVLNHTRWVQATPEFADRVLYRQYLVNHEVGHLLGHPHEQCPEAGAVAPLMQQQSVEVAPCTPNGWPYP